MTPITPWSLLPDALFPWVSFKDVLTLDRLWRDQEAMEAVIRWPYASATLLIDARHEWDWLASTIRKWSADMDQRAAAYISWPT